MATRQQTAAWKPVSEKNLDGYGSPPIPWSRVVEGLDKSATLSPLDAAGRTWLATVRPDGRPHVMPVGALRLDGALYFTAGPGSRKARNVAANPRCVITVASPGIDVVVEGDATRVTDEAKLQRLAAAYGAAGWAPTVRDGAFYHEFSAPSAGPPPWHVYEVAPKTVFGLATAEPSGAMRWRFR